MVFKTDDVVKALDDVAPSRRCVFSALCAERLLPWVDIVAKEVTAVDPTAIHDGLELIWGYAEANHYDELAAAALYERCEAQVERSWKHAWANAANDCIASVLYGLMAVRSNRATDAAWAGMRITDSIYQFVCTNIVFKGQTGPVRMTKADLSAALAHPLHQAELLRQAADLTDLQKVDASTVATSLQDLRARARAAVPSVFAVMPK